MAEYIERERAIQKVKNVIATEWFRGNYEAIGPLQRVVNVQLGRMTAADVAPVVHGGWIPLLESEISGWNPEFAGNDPIGGYMCSVCKEEAIYDCNDEFVLSKFCPYCGAKMCEDG